MELTLFKILLTVVLSIPIWFPLLLIFLFRNKNDL